MLDYRQSFTLFPPSPSFSMVTTFPKLTFLFFIFLFFFSKIAITQPALVWWATLQSDAQPYNKCIAALWTSGVGTLRTYW